MGSSVPMSKVGQVSNPRIVIVILVILAVAFAVSVGVGVNQPSRAPSNFPEEGSWPDRLGRIAEDLGLSQGFVEQICFKKKPSDRSCMTTFQVPDSGSQSFVAQPSEDQGDSPSKATFIVKGGSPTITYQDSHENMEDAQICPGEKCKKKPWTITATSKGGSLTITCDNGPCRLEIERE